MLPSEGPFTYDAAGPRREGTHLGAASAAPSSSPTNLDTTAPLQPLVSPTTLDAPDLRWGAVAGAEYYRIEIGNAATGNWYAPS